MRPAVTDTKRRAMGQIKDLDSAYHLNPHDKRLITFADVCTVAPAQHPTEHALETQVGGLIQLPLYCYSPKSSHKSHILAQGALKFVQTLITMTPHFQS